MLLDEQTLRSTIHALYDYKFETERYLGSWKPHNPKPSDLCCDEHRFRYEQHEAINADLARRLSTIVTAINTFEALLTAASAPKGSTRTADASDGDPLDAAEAIHEQYVTWLRDVPESQRTPQGAPGHRTRPEVVLPDAIADAAVSTMFAATARDPRLGALLAVFREVDAEWTKGYRCAACGKADDPTFDHTRNC